MKFLGTDYERSVEQDLISYRPNYYQNSKVVNEITKVDAEELELLYSRITEVLEQFFIEKATWGLDMWEEMMNIRTDHSKPYDQRRSQIKSKIRRYGTSTIDMVKNIAESYLNGEVDISEYNKNLIDLRNHTFYEGYIDQNGTLVQNPSTTWSQDENKLIISTTATNGNGGITTEFIPIMSFQNISVGSNIRHATGQVTYVSIAFYDRDKKFISRTLSNVDSELLNNVMPPSNAQFARASFRVKQGEGIELSPQIEYGPEATKYEPRKDYTIGVTFIGKRGRPPNLDDIKNAIRGVTPSHLDLIYTFTYMIWGEIESALMTWEDFEQYTFEQMEGSFV